MPTVKPDRLLTLLFLWMIVSPVQAERADIFDEMVIFDCTEPVPDKHLGAVEDRIRNIDAWKKYIGIVPRKDMYYVNDGFQWERGTTTVTETYYETCVSGVRSVRGCTAYILDRRSLVLAMGKNDGWLLQCVAIDAREFEVKRDSWRREKPVALVRQKVNK